MKKICDNCQKEKAPFDVCEKCIKKILNKTQLNKQEDKNGKS